MYMYILFKKMYVYKCVCMHTRVHTHTYNYKLCTFFEKSPPPPLEPNPDFAKVVFICFQ